MRTFNYKEGEGGDGMSQDTLNQALQASNLSHEEEIYEAWGRYMMANYAPLFAERALSQKWQLAAYLGA